jgi:hypothetical protein
MVSETKHRANYERESNQKTMTAIELHAKLGEIIAAGKGARPIFRMDCDRGDGLTHAEPIGDCIASEPYDGEIVWLLGTDVQIV